MPREPLYRRTDRFALKQAESGATIAGIRRRMRIAEAISHRPKTARDSTEVAEIRRLKAA